ncbi:PAS domain-containing sensor histidine kinase [Paenibacillus cremeus]|uniref:histidine kinase n=1 Tax=Paenibacillus cremeus TaxID=2163881 RepID=A0A559KIM8_9BACL|nr:PAS domain-containing sensor histidine kinase [Paenibacillus cremeus]TVY11982.1 PAS domain S-box protein [Paenibacillus cremeus]
MTSAHSDSGAIGRNVEYLLGELDRHIHDPAYRDRLKRSLKQLIDVKFALDESSIVAITDPRGKILYVNDTFCKISKFSRDELLGQDHRMINSGHHSKAFMKQLWATISSGQVWSGDIKNKAKDGTYYWVNTTIVPFLSEAGEPYQYLAIRNEVTRLKKIEEELQHMMTKVIQIQEEERQRFSRELHDGIGQSLFSLLIQMDHIISEHQLAGQLGKLRQEVSHIMEDVRGLAWELRPSILDDMGVVPAIRRHLEKFSQHYGIQVDFECNLRKRLSFHMETAIYRIIQESLMNLAKYAEVSSASLSIRETENMLFVEIVDHGKGFDLNADRSGVGLFSMEERARGIGGTLKVRSVPDDGTTVTLTVPLQRDDSVR